MYKQTKVKLVTCGSQYCELGIRVLPIFDFLLLFEFSDLCAFLTQFLTNLFDEFFDKYFDKYFDEFYEEFLDAFHDEFHVSCSNTHDSGFWRSLRPGGTFSNHVGTKMLQKFSKNLIFFDFHLQKSRIPQYPHAMLKHS